MKLRCALLLSSTVLLAGCTSSPRSQDTVRRTTAAVTRTVASDVKGAALGIRDGLRHDPGDDAVDVNTATAAQLAALPGLSKAEAAHIVEGRPYQHASDLLHRKILPKAVYNKVAARLIVR